MRKIILAACLLAGCTPAQVAQVQNANAVFCQKDGALQPILVPLNAAVATAVVPTAAPVVAGAVALDTAVVHPSIVAACAAVNATPVAVPVAK